MNFRTQACINELILNSLSSDSEDAKTTFRFSGRKMVN